MISFQKRFLFVHVPKTAGNSIQSVLRHYSEDEIIAQRGEQEGVERFGVRNPKYSIKKHSTLAEYRDALGEEKFRDLYKFSCVRNPWDRMISLYFSPGRKVATWDRAAFEELVSKTQSLPDHLRLEKGDSNPFSNVDRVMRFENLAEDFKSVCEKLEVPAATLPTYNRSSRDDYAKYYDDELREFVGRRFAAEIELFGYRFE